MTEVASVHTTITGDSSSLVAAAKRGATVLDQYGNAIQRNNKAASGLAKSAQASAAAQNKFVQRLRTGIRQAKNYGGALGTVSTAYKTGALSAKQLEAATQASAAAFNTGAAAADTMNRSVRASRFHTANLAAQFNDIGVMMASGQSPFILAAQQGTQISQVLNTMGGTAKQQLGALKAAMLSVISPTTLVTVGLIAGVAALANWARSSDDAAAETDDLEDSLANLNEISGDVEDNMEILALNAAEAKEQFGEMAGAVKQAAKNLILLDKAEATISLQKQVRALRDVSEGWIQVEQDAFLYRTEQDKTANAIRQFTKNLADQGVAVDGNEAAVRQLYETTLLFNNSNVLEDQTAAVDAMAAAYMRLDGNLNNVPDSMRAVMRATEETLIDQARLNKILNDFEAGNVDPYAPGRRKKDTRTAAERDDPFGALENDRQRKDELAAEIDRIVEEQATKLELENQFHIERQMLLQEALEKRLVTQQEYDELMENEVRDHENRVTRIRTDAQDRQLQGYAAFMGGMADVLATGGEKMMKISKVFGAAEALINAWRAYAQVLADPTLPWSMKIAMALKVLAAGIQAVQAVQSVGKGGSGKKSADAQAEGAGTIQAQERPNIVNANINVRGQVFDRGAVVGLIEQINEAVGDGARIRVV